MRMIGAKFFTRNVTVWPVSTGGIYNDVTFGEPKLLKCWFTETNEVSKNADGQERVSKYKILTSGDNRQYVGERYYVVVDRDETLTLDPTEIKGAIDIHSVGVVAGDAIGSQDLVKIMV